MVVEALIGLLKTKLILSRLITDELPESIQERINKQKKSFFYSLDQLIKEELDEKRKTTKQAQKINKISID